MKKSQLKQIIKEELHKMLNEDTKIDEQGNIIYSLEDANFDYSDSAEILVTWEIDDFDSKTKIKLRNFEWDDKEDYIYAYIDVDELKKFIKNPVELTIKFKAPGGYFSCTKQDAIDIMDSYYENFPDEINPDLN